MKPRVKIANWQLTRVYHFIASVRQCLRLHGMHHEANLFDAYATSDSTNPIAEALKYVELEIK